ncbi:MAG: EamA family transporter [Alphaproteobacteria bacterium]|nr:EamA family transporter [Alphaproteobacteria bacterium]
MSQLLLISLPFIAALCYGLGYVLIEKVVGVHVNVTTYLFCSYLTGFMLLVPVLIFFQEPISVGKLLKSLSVLVLVLSTCLLINLGGLATFFSIKANSAIYTAFAETSYPLFTLAFGVFLFAAKKPNMITIIGGIIVFFGAVTMIYGQSVLKQNV